MRQLVASVGHLTRDRGSGPSSHARIGSSPRSYDLAVPRLMLGWTFFVFGSFAITVLTLSFVQMRGISKYGWRDFRKRSPRQTYWDELTWWQRALLFPGFCAFMIT